MPEFKFRAKNAGGENISGSISAISENDAVSQLKGRNLTIMTIKESLGKREIHLFGNREPRPHIRTDDMVLFTRQLATMISAGIPLLEALEILQEQVEDKGFSHLIGKIVYDVRTGSDLSTAMARHPKAFSTLYVNMIKAGEASGQLDEILVRLAEYQESTAKLKREIKAAMTYPAVSMLLVISITIFLMVFIVPQFKDIFDSLGIDLPPLTKFVLAVSLMIRDQFALTISVLVAIVVGVFFYVHKTKTGRRQWDWLKMRVPIFGPLFRKVAISRFSKTFSTLLKSGVPMLGALEIVSGTAGNSIISETVDKAKERVKQGENLAEPLSENEVFPPMVVKMIAIGEKSGALEQLLEKVSEFYDQQVSSTVESLTSLIEPLMIAIMGIGVGTIVLSIFLPIIKIQQKLAAG